MSHPQHTSLSLRTRLGAIAHAAEQVDGSDYFALARMTAQISELKVQMVRDNAGSSTDLCDAIVKLLEAIDKDGNVNAPHLLQHVRAVLATMCKLLSVDTAAAKELAATGTEAGATVGPAAMKVLAATNNQAGLKLVSSKRLGEMLIQMSLLKPEQVEQALQYQRVNGCRLGEALVQMKVLSREAVESALRMQGSRRNTSKNPWTTQ